MREFIPPPIPTMSSAFNGCQHSNSRFCGRARPKSIYRPPRVTQYWPSGAIVNYSIEALEDQLAISLIALEQDLTRVQSIVAWEWIVNALMK